MVVPPAMLRGMMIVAVVMMIMAVAVNADTHANAADMHADADTRIGRACAQKRQRKNRSNDLLHEKSLLECTAANARRYTVNGAQPWPVPKRYCREVSPLFARCRENGTIILTGGNTSPVLIAS